MQPKCKLMSRRERIPERPNGERRWKTWIQSKKVEEELFASQTNGRKEEEKNKLKNDGFHSRKKPYKNTEKFPQNYR